ncbi:MAG: hypothetical protein KDD70_00735, partial [Bdellovibrionales bacterium]|nr:hypothetical protein [Bdellovibrionales bacterium]
MSVFDAFDLGNLAINFLAQGEVGISLPIDSTCNPFRLFGSSFHAITAAWATLGYYAQSDVLYYMHLGWEKFSILLYTVAGIAGLIMMAMGQPPRNWLWFFIGPGIYYFAIDTPAQVHGVAWMVGPYMQPQNEVWRLAESGAVNMGVTRRGAIRFDKNGPYGGTGPNALPGGLVEVSLPFVMLDSFLSDTVRQLSVWTGALSQSNPYLELGVPNSADTNVALESTAPNFMFGEALGSNEVCQDSQNHFATFTNSKWTFLNNVTQAELTNSDARDALSRFVADECGEHLTKAIDFTEFARATNYTESFLPDTVFNQRGAAGAGFSRLYKTLRMELAQTTVPTPTSLKNLLTDSVDNAIPTLTNGSSFVRSVEWLPNGPGNLCGRDQEAVPNALAVVNAILERDRIPCDAYFYVLLLYFRYEAAIIFSQSFQNGGPGGWYPEDMTYNILYGWDIPFNDTGLCSAKHPRGFSVPGQYQFVYNLILAHLFRNELNRLPELVSVGKDKTETILDDSQLYNSTIGSTSKAAEVYTWSLMIPYVQGILLYMLSLAFPIVCMVMLVPSWNKIIITWTSFFVWVKLWDLGFAFVSSLERSLWAMMANSNSSYLINQKVLEMSDYGGFNDLRCVANWPITGGGGTRRVLEPIEKCISNFGANAQPALILTEGPGWCQGATDYGACLNVFDANVTPANPLLNDSAFDATLRLFDLSLIVGSSLDFDLANGYYIYIMSALYFAVPAVTGQMVLGAKSGVAGMVDKIAGDPAGKAAGAAGSSFTGNEAARMKQNAASVSQETNAADQRSTGLVHRALDQQNAAATHSLAASHMGQAGEGARRIAGAVSHGNQAASKDVALIAGVVKAAVGSQSRPIIKSPNMGPPAGTTTASNIGNDAVNRHRPDDADGQNRPGVPLGAMPSAARDVP